MNIDRNEIVSILHEELTRGDVRAMINSELEDYTKNDKMKKAVKSIAADVLEDFIDNLWRKKSFWRGSIKKN